MIPQGSCDNDLANPEWVR